MRVMKINMNYITVYQIDGAKNVISANCGTINEREVKYVFPLYPLLMH
jgi:hypothetical protein